MLTKSLILSLLLSYPLISIASPIKISYQKGDSHRPSKMHAEGIIKGEPEQIWEIIIRINDWSHFMPRMPVSHYVSEEGVVAIQKTRNQNPKFLSKLAAQFKIDRKPHRRGKWGGIAFQVVNTPFPVANRWFLLRYLNNESKIYERKYEQCWSMIDGNVRSVQGCFRLQPTEKRGETFLYYEEISDLGGHIPEWVVKLGVRMTTPDVFHNLEREATSH
ncbi:MAG: hypothetical protein HYT77_00115 [Deltaproteobacteria bacterium]|nr:hypothetical protein [Deltaproteobacteria bacterium]